MARFLRAAAAFVLSGAAALPLLYFVAITVDPAELPDGPCLRRDDRLGPACR